MKELSEDVLYADYAWLYTNRVLLSVHFCPFAAENSGRLRHGDMKPIHYIVKILPCGFVFLLHILAPLDCARFVLVRPSSSLVVLYRALFT